MGVFLHSEAPVEAAVQTALQVAEGAAAENANVIINHSEVYVWTSL